jgi:hypothetical protein
VISKWGHRLILKITVSGVGVFLVKGPLFRGPFGPDEFEELQEAYDELSEE